MVLRLGYISMLYSNNNKVTEQYLVTSRYKIRYIVEVYTIQNETVYMYNITHSMVNHP